MTRESNHLIRPVGIRQIVSLVLCFLWLLLTTAPLDAQDEVSDLLGRINNLRAAKGLPAYSLNGVLSAAAQSQSQWLIDNDCAIAHVHPDGSSPRSRAQAAGYPSLEVSENIYCGGIAAVNDAWLFWVNSPVHYAGLTNARFSEIGIGVVHGANSSGFTLVFGNPGGSAYVPPGAANSSGSAAGLSGQPAYVVGVDEHGNIKHEVQPGDTIGDILLIYGYTWADTPTLLALNNMTQDDFRSLKVGSILLIPPQDGTYTPTPGDAALTATPEAPTSEPAAQTAAEVLPTSTLAPTETPVPFSPTEVIAPTSENAGIEPAALILPTETATAQVVLSTTPQQVALAGTALPVSNAKSAGVVSRAAGTSPALVIALIVQAVVLLGAGVEFVRRMRRRKS